MSTSDSSVPLADGAARVDGQSVVADGSVVTRDGSVVTRDGSVATPDAAAPDGKIPDAAIPDAKVPDAKFPDASAGFAFETARCQSAGKGVGPLSNEYGDRLAARFGPPVGATRFAVSGAEVTLTSGSPCNKYGAITIDFFKSSSMAPPANPTILYSHQTTVRNFNGTPNVAPHNLPISLPSPIEVAAGEYLFMSVHMDFRTAVEGSGTVCVDSCNANAPRGQYLWGASATPPHNWSNMSDLGFPEHMAMRILGTAY